MDNLFIAQACVYGFALWFGLYLLARGAEKPGLASAGLGLLTYATGLALVSISRYSPLLTEFVAPRHLLVVLMPSVYWFAAAASLFAETDHPESATRILLKPIPITIIGFGVLVVSDASLLVRSLAPVVFMIAALWWLAKTFKRPYSGTMIKLLATAALLFLMSIGLLILPQEIVSNELALIGMSGDMILLGYSMSKLHAQEEGTALLPDLLPSLSRAVIAAGAVGAQFVVLLAAGSPPTGPLITLFYTTLGTVIGLFTWQGTLQKYLDHVLFGRQTRLLQERETLIAVAEALPRQDTSLDVLKMDEAEFTRLTRRTLSHYNDLSKLVSSPLIQLPIITEQLRSKGKADTSLERAHELRALLEDQILQLRPDSDKDFGTGDDWRYYNALYFPYVLELKPYNIKPLPAPIDPVTQQVLDWFQTYVPERTLYNWQTSAAKLIARQLRETAKPKHAVM